MGSPGIELAEMIPPEKPRSKAVDKGESPLAEIDALALVDLAPVLGRDLHDHIIYWGGGAQAMYGFTSEEALGRISHELLSSEFLQSLDKVMDEVLRTGRWEGEISHLCKNRKRILVNSLWVLHRNQQNQPCAILEVNHDITDIRNAQRALQHSRSQLAQANENLERIVQERTARLQDTLSDLEHFSHTITHDLRGPLRTLQGFGSLILEEGDELTPAETREHVERIVGAARKMDLLITDALDYSRAVRQELPLVAVDPAAVIQSTIATYPHLQNHRASIRIDGPLPPVLANQTGLVQCFANLLGNAVKFVRPGVFPQIRIWAEQIQVRVRIWIEDNGIGIPERFQPKLFTIFQRGSHEFEGTGIGLALVKKVLDRMGGTTGAVSEPGCGSRFWIELRSAQTGRDSKSQ